MCIMVFVVYDCKQHSFGALAQLVASCERRNVWDLLFERALHILLHKVQEEER